MVDYNLSINFPLNFPEPVKDLDGVITAILMVLQGAIICIQAISKLILSVTAFLLHLIGGSFFSGSILLLLTSVIDLLLLAFFLNHAYKTMKGFIKYVCVIILGLLILSFLYYAFTTKI